MTSITISGQINSVGTLRNSINGGELKKLQFNNVSIIYKTKKEAVKMLSDAFQSLKFDEPEYYKDGGISYCRASSLSYDAATATINEM